MQPFDDDRHPAPRRGSPYVWLSLAVVVLLGMAVLAYRTTRPRAAAPVAAGPAVARKQLTFVGDASFPAISPDNNSLAFVRGEPWGRVSRPLEPLQPQKVTIQDLAGGRQLEAGECRPCGAVAWSADGSTLLVSDGSRSLTLIPRQGGAPRRLEGSGFLAWSPAGAEFARAAVGSSEIVFTNPTTNETRRMPLKAAVSSVLGLDWSPRGHRLAVLTIDSNGRSAFSLISPDGRTQDKVHEDTPAVVSVRWSPRGDALYYMRADGDTHDLWRLDLARETGPAQGDPSVVLAGLQAGPNFSVSRDGRQLLYTREVHYANLWAARLDSTTVEPRAITSGTSRDQFPAVSPDGTLVAFTREEGATANVFTVPIGGGPAQPLTSQMSVVGAPAWSPDGKALAFCAPSQGVNVVWQIAAAGGSPRPFPATRCTTTASEVPVSWAPAREILYQRVGNRNYYILDPETSAERPLISDESVGWIFGPRASRDGWMVAAFWNRSDGAGRGVWMIPWSGGTPSLLLDDVAWPLGWSEDGKNLFAYIHAPTPQILSVPDSGRGRTVLRTLAGQRIGLVPSISPDGRTVVYSAHAIHSDVWMAQDFDPAMAK